MQRWILLGLVAGLLLVVGAGAGLWIMRQNRPDQQWVPMPLNPQSSIEDREALVKSVQLMLQEDSFLLQVVKDLSLQQKWDVASPEAAQELLRTRMFVRLGEYRHPLTQERFDTLDIGIHGISKENQLLGEVASRLATEVGKNLGLGKSQEQ